MSNTSNSASSWWRGLLRSESSQQQTERDNCHTVVAPPAIVRAMRDGRPDEQTLGDLCIDIAPEWLPKYQRIVAYLHDDLKGARKTVASGADVAPRNAALLVHEIPAR